MIIDGSTVEITVYEKKKIIFLQCCKGPLIGAVVT